jgi:hypothetical protein
LQLPLIFALPKLCAHLGVDIEGVGAFYHTLAGKDAGKKNVRSGEALKGIREDR